MIVTYKPLESKSGFQSPGFTVDELGNLAANSINSLGSLLINGLPFISGSELASTVTGSNLTSLGRLTELHAAADTFLNDILTVTSAGITTSSSTLLELNGGALRIDPINTPNTVEIGSIGATAISLSVSGRISINSTATSSSVTSGALTVDGGAGIAENIHVGGNAYITGDTYIAGQNIKSLAAALAVALS
jgi:hypothetical protein